MKEDETQLKLNEYLEDRADLVLVTYNRLEFTKRTLDFLFKRTISPYRLIIVDNGSTDGTREYLQKINCDTLILFDRNYGLEHARSVALSHVQSKYHVYFDNDLICPAPKNGTDWLSTEIKMMDKYSEYGAMAMHPQLLVGASIDMNSSEEVIHNNHVGATFLIMRTHLMKEIGWRDSFTNRVADWHFGSKFTKMGYKSGWIKSLWCYHFFGENWGYDSETDHYHREIFPPSQAYDRLVDPLTLEPKADGVNMFLYEEK